MSDTIPDLKSVLAEATPAAASVTLPLKQGLRDRIEQAEAELATMASDAPKRRSSHV